MFQKCRARNSPIFGNLETCPVETGRYDSHLPEGFARLAPGPLNSGPLGPLVRWWKITATRPGMPSARRADSRFYLPAKGPGRIEKTLMNDFGNICERSAARPGTFRGALNNSA